MDGNSLFGVMSSERRYKIIPLNREKSPNSGNSNCCSVSLVKFGSALHFTETSFEIPENKLEEPSPKINIHYKIKCNAHTFITAFKNILTGTE